MDQTQRLSRLVGVNSAIKRQRLGESTVLERQVAEQLQRVVAERTAKRLLDHLPQDVAIVLFLALLEPTTGLRVDSTAINLSTLGGQRRQTSLAIFPRADEEVDPTAGVRRRIVFRQRRHRIAELRDHLLINIDRFRPLAVANVREALRKSESA